MRVVKVGRVERRRARLVVCALYGLGFLAYLSKRGRLIRVLETFWDASKLVLNCQLMWDQMPAYGLRF